MSVMVGQLTPNGWWKQSWSEGRTCTYSQRGLESDCWLFISLTSIHICVTICMFLSGLFVIAFFFIFLSESCCIDLTTYV